MGKVFARPLVACLIGKEWGSRQGGPGVAPRASFLFEAGKERVRASFPFKAGDNGWLSGRRAVPRASFPFQAGEDKPRNMPRYGNSRYLSKRPSSR